MSGTRRLTFEDARTLDFEAEVLDVRGLAVVLSASAFYPEGGGQPADTGELSLGSSANTRVLDVQITDDGEIVHTLAALPEGLASGALVRGRVDGPRRREFSALHTAQHVLSRALEDEAAAPTVSARLGGSAATIDVGRPEIPEALLARAEALARSVAADDLPVRAWFPSPAELAALPLRRRPKVEEDIRIVAVGDFDFTPCGGTHVGFSGALSPITIVGTERHKGMTRVTFTAGPRGQRELCETFRAAQRLAEGLKTTTADLEAAVGRLEAEAKGLRGERGALRAAIAVAVAAELVGSLAGPVAVFARDDLDAALTRDVASRVRERLGAGARLVVGLGAADADARPIVLMRGADAACDAGKLLRALTAELGGKGGGRADFAEGRARADVSADAVRTLLERALAT